MNKNTDLAARMASPLAQGLAGGALGLLPLGRLTGWGKALFIGLPAAAAAAGGTLWTLSSTGKGLGRKAAVSFAGTAVLAGSQWLAIVIDRKMESGLRKRGVTCPRLVIAAISGVATAGVAVLEKNSAKHEH